MFFGEHSISMFFKEHSGIYVIPLSIKKNAPDINKNITWLKNKIRKTQ